MIPVRDGGTDLERCLDALARQRYDGELEVVVVDSGSRDGSDELAQRRGARVERIAPEDFDHGATRNLGCRLAGGETLVFISQDAEPVGDEWLASLVAPLDDPSVAGVYGRQLARPTAVPPERFFLDYMYGPEPRVQKLAGDERPSVETTMFSNANSAIRRSAWETHPFADDLIMSEDQDWARRALADGWSIVYEPAAGVLHSHAYSIATAFRRFFDSGVSAKRSYLPGGSQAARALRHRLWRYARDEIRWLVSSGNARWIPYTVVYEASKLLGLALGLQHRRLPLSLSRRLSAMPGYWQRAGER